MRQFRETALSGARGNAIAGRRRLVRGAFMLLVPFMLACEDGITGPALIVTVYGPTIVPAVVVDTVGGRIYQCDRVLLDLIATGGREGSTATWLGASIRLVGLTSGRHIYSESFSAIQVADWLGGSVLPRDTPRSMTWSGWAGEPFRSDVSYFYRPSTSRSTGTASFSFRCE